MGRIVAVVLMAALLVSFAPNPVVFGEEGVLYSQKSGCPTPVAGASLLCEWKSGAVIHSQNASIRMPMASTTKIMTAVIIAETLPLDRVVTVNGEAAGTEGSSIYLYEGEKLTVEELLYGLMLESANDAAAALAIEAAGSIEDFASLMNLKAKQLGLKDTHFTNPHGLDHPDHYTTAEELAKIAAYALENQTVAKIVSTKSYRTANRIMTNHNRMLFCYDGAIGLKTGYTIKTGRCLVSGATRDGMTLIAVTLNCRNDWQAHKNLLDWGFSNYQRKVAAKEGEFSFEVMVTGGVYDRVCVTNQYPLSVFADRDVGEFRYEVILKRLMFAPVEKGSTIGVVNFYLGDKFAGQLELTAAYRVEKKQIPLTFWQRICQFFNTLFD